MRATSLLQLVSVLLTAATCGSQALANTPPALSTASNSPEAPLGAAYNGGLGGTATVSAGGNAVYQLPIDVPPGTGEATPNLRLVYNSNVDNGLLGLGWFLQGVDSKITRCPQTVAQDGARHAVDFSYDDRFCLNGHRLLVVSGTYGQAGSEYVTETDQFSRITAYGTTGNGPAYFVVETKGGHTQYFGNTSDSAVEDESGTHIRWWRMNRNEDRTGNYYDVVYHENTTEGESYPTSISYSGNDTAGLTPNATIDLEYSARNDNVLSFQGGSRVHKHPKRITGLSIRVGGTEVYRYNLSYTETGFGELSRLSAVERCDAFGSCQDSLTIAWQYTGNADTYSSEWINTPTYRGPNYSPSDPRARNMTPMTNHARWHDLNGDGKTDYLIHNPTRAISGVGRKTFDVTLSTPTGYISDTWVIGQEINNHHDLHFADVNADGRMDVVYAQTSYSTTIKVSLASASGFINLDYGTIATRHNGLAHTTSFQDMDGDGLVDLVVTNRSHYSGSSGSRSIYYDVWVSLNDGSSFQSATKWANDASLQTAIGDMNGDGLPDLIHRSNRVRLNTGSGFAGSIIWGDEAPLYLSGNYWLPRSSFKDYNRDGLLDRKVMNSSGSWEIELNNGRSFEAGVSSSGWYSADYNADNFLDKRTYSVQTLSSNPYQQASLSVTHGDLAPPLSGTTQDLLTNTSSFNIFASAADVDGDGFIDPTVKRTVYCAYNQSPFRKYYCETDQSRIYRNNAERPNLISSITEPSGRTIAFEYDHLASGDSYTKGTGATLPELDIQDSTRVVKRLLISDGIGGDFETTYKYEGYKWNLDGRGILGFAKIIAENHDTGIETTTEYEQEFPLVMQPKHVEQRRVSDGRLLAETTTTYAVNGTVGAGPVFPYVQNQVEKRYALSDGRLLVTKTTDRTVDAYGNTTSVTEETDDAENTETRKTVTSNTYTVDLTNWWVGQLTATSTEFWLNGGMSSADTRQTTFTYGTTYGLLKTSTRQPGGGAGIELTTTRTHDAFGNVLTETVSGPGLTSRTNTVTHDTRGQFPLTLTNALGHATTQTWHATWGKKLTQTGPNGQTTSWSYDSFGRQTLETRPDGTTTSTLTYKDPTGSGVNAAFYTEVLETGKAPKRVFVDLLGRTVRERSQRFNGDYINVDSEYDATGRLSRQSEPYVAGGSVYWNTFSYDDLGRVTSLAAADPVASTTTSYDGLSTTVTDSASRSETQTIDAGGRVIQVIDKDGTPLVITYDAQGNRSTVTSASGTTVASTVTYTYDRYGRLLQQDDPDHGTYTYTYDALGNKLSEVSPEMAAAIPAESRTFSYDVLGRMTSRTEPEGTATWTYDNTTGGNLGLGKVHSESQSGFTREFTYGAGNYGRLTAIQTSIGGSTYTEAKSYNASGQLASEIFPSSPSSPGGYQVDYTYNALGYLERVQAPGGSQVYYQTVATDAAGRLTEEWLGDGSTVTTGFDGVSSRVVSQLSQRTGTIQQFSYTYDASGNMLTRNDVLQSLSESFTYDDLDRLTSAEVTGQSAVQYAFDEVGSITQKSDVASVYDYVSGPQHAVTLLTQGASTQSLSYDGNGNLTFGTDEPSVTWSSYNKPTQLTKGGITYDFDYGPDRKRYKKQRNTDITYYIGSRFEHTFAAAVTYRTVIHANGRAVMIREDVSGSGVTHKYMHRDHLGSVTALTDEATGNVLDRLSYDAWGLRRNASTWVAGAVTASDHRGYTGHEHLDDIGIIHMNGRIYSPKLGRMLSPDPVTQAPENGQNYDRYTYAYNNPLKYSDPSGYSSELGQDGGVTVGYGGTSGGIVGTGGRSAWGYARWYAGNGDTRLLDYLEGRLEESDFYDGGGSGANSNPVPEINAMPQPEIGDRTGAEASDLIAKAESGHTECDDNGIVCIEYGYDEELILTGRSRVDWQEVNESDWFDVVGLPPSKKAIQVITGRKIAAPDIGTYQQAIQKGIPELEYRVHRRYWQRRTVNGIETPGSRQQIGGLTPTLETTWASAPGVPLSERRWHRICVATGGDSRACSGGVAF